MLCIESTVNDRLRILVGREGQAIVPFQRCVMGNNDSYIANKQPITYFNIKWGEALYTIDASRNLQFQLEAGLFPYKYDPEARNLAEYVIML
jgi:hypothetical protein